MKAFWQQLTAVYYEVNQEELAFVTQQIMHRQNMLKTSKELSAWPSFIFITNPDQGGALFADRT